MVSIGLSVVVLLQHGKGADIGAVFGGGASSTVFGSRGAGNFLTKLTTGSALVFIVSNLSLAHLSHARRTRRPTPPPPPAPRRPAPAKPRPPPKRRTAASRK